MTNYARHVTDALGAKWSRLRKQFDLNFASCVPKSHFPCCYIKWQRELLESKSDAGDVADDTTTYMCCNNFSNLCRVWKILKLMQQLTQKYPPKTNIRRVMSTLCNQDGEVVDTSEVNYTLKPT